MRSRAGRTEPREDRPGLRPFPTRCASWSEPGKGAGYFELLADSRQREGAAADDGGHRRRPGGRFTALLAAQAARLQTRPFREAVLARGAGIGWGRAIATSFARLGATGVWSRGRERLQDARRREPSKPAGSIVESTCASPDEAEFQRRSRDERVSRTLPAWRIREFGRSVIDSPNARSIDARGRR